MTSSYFTGSSKAEKIENEIFDGDFNIRMHVIDIRHKDFENECKTYSGLKVAQDQIRSTPGRKER